jgi:hypothetical protein
MHFFMGLLLFSFEDLVDFYNKRAVQERKQERLQRKNLNPLGAFI